MTSEVTAPISLKGRVLSRHAVQRNGSLSLHYYLATASGPVRVEVADCEYLCFCHQTDVARLVATLASGGIRIVPLALQSFQSQAVSGIYCSSSHQQKAVQRSARDLGIALFEADIRPEQRFLIERFVALDVEFLGSFAWGSSQDKPDALPSNASPYGGSDMRVDAFPTLGVFHAQKARRCDNSDNVSLSSVSLDFECSFDGELYSVGLYSDDIRKVIMVGDAPVINEPAISAPAMKANPDASKPLAEVTSVSIARAIEWVANEAALIQRLIHWFETYDPDVIIGWSVVTFDLALLYKRAKLHRIPLTLGRGGALLTWKVEDKYRPETLSLPGRVVLDGIDWLKAAFYQFDSYSLEHVSRQLLQEGKAIHDVANRGAEITTLFNQDKLALAHYNLTDCRLVWDIFAKTQLWDFALARAELTGLELGRVGASVAAFNHLYLPHLHRAGFVAPHMPVSQGLESPGGYVMDSLPGLYKNILVLDFKSLYPSIIRTFLIDPKGLIEGARLGDDDTVAGFLGARFNRQAPILPELITSLSEQREQAKRDRNAPLSQAIKIIMNSLYGVLGSQGCVFHDARLASSITMRGHEIMKQTRAWIEEQGYQVIYGDTDSTFVWLGDEPDDDADVIGRQLVSTVNQLWQQKLQLEYQLPSFLELEFERHYEQFFMPTLRGSTEGSKKRYVGAYRGKDGDLALIFKGMEQVRSDWSPLARRLQHALYERLFNQLDIRQYLKDEVEGLLTGRLDKELIFKKRLRRQLSEYTAKASPHVKVAHQLVEVTGDIQYTKRGALIEYVITTNGPEAVTYRKHPIDYQYYIERQIRPIAEPVFLVLNEDYESIASKQLLLI